MRKILACCFVLFITWGLSAQTRTPQAETRTPQAGTRTGEAPKAAPQKVTLTGDLALVNGNIALKSGEDTYYVRGIGHLVGFVEGLKEGERVSMEGFARSSRRDENVKIFFASKLTVKDRSYDLVPPRQNVGVSGESRRRGPGHAGTRRGYMPPYPMMSPYGCASPWGWPVMPGPAGRYHYQRKAPGQERD